MAGLHPRCRRPGTQGGSIGYPDRTTGYEVKMMWEDIGIPKRVESQRNSEWVLVWDLMEEQNGHT